MLCKEDKVVHLVIADVHPLSYFIGHWYKRNWLIFAQNEYQFTFYSTPSNPAFTVVGVNRPKYVYQKWLNINSNAVQLDENIITIKIYGK